ncbi:methyl-accepting chemotaxis protein [Treponema sp.]|uniref:methyl-accepting chemotaxis protein n=1 Tax=Treponema sp. TaxID=166 RepID=UPI00298EC905|nr:methyl-accepting chemotaxis protein [Treponema sp.]MCQ2240112.1 methyl-accepting chemotaxis protein [Treponema sp.]
MKRKISLKIKLLTVIVGLIVVCSVSQGAIVHNIADKALEDAVSKGVSSMTEKVALDISIRNSEEMRFARNLAKLSVITGDEYTTEEKCNLLLPIVKESNGRYVNIAFYDKDGYSYIPEKPGVPVYFGDRGYIKAPLSGKEYIRDPFVNTITGQLIMCYCVPVYKDGSIVGALCCVRDGNFISEIIESMDVGGGMHPGIINMKTGETVGNANKDTAKGNSVNDLDPNSDLAKIFKNAMAGNIAIETFVDPANHQKMLASYQPIADSDWFVFCAAPYDYYYGSLTYLNRTITIILIVAILVGAIVGIISISGLIRPLFYVKNSIAEISSGHADLSSRITQSSNDEVGEVVDGFNTFVGKLQTIMTQLKSSKVELASAGDNLVASAEDTSASITEIIANIDSVHNQINNQSNSVTETAGAVNEIASNIDSLERMIENQSDGISQASAAVEQMIGNIRSVNSSVEKMASSFENLSSSATSGAQIQHDVNEKIEKIKVQSETLQEANIAISAIAAQTNLLAMNAAIEAAHAGEAGKGFSVVADEIRKLSETSSAQSKTIGEELNSIRDAIDSVVAASNMSSSAFQNVAMKIQETDELVRQIKSAMDEQTEGSQQINEALHNMNDSTAEVKSASREMSEGNRQILSEVKNLQDATQVMKLSMEEMSAGARKINETGVVLSDISAAMKESIEKIGGEIDQFKV